MKRKTQTARKILRAFDIATVLLIALALAGTLLALPAQQHVQAATQSPQATAEECQELPDELKQSCLAGHLYVSAYKNENPKIQNPIAKQNLLFFYTPPESTVGNQNIRSLWTAMITVVDGLAVVAIIMTGIRVIFAGITFRFAKAVEELPGILLALIAAHVSLFFITVLVDLQNSLTGGIYTVAEYSNSIQRSGSGFGTGDEKTMELHVLFPTYNEEDKDHFEKEGKDKYKSMTPEQAAKLWHAPNTDETLQKMKGKSCTWSKTSFDQYGRWVLFDDDGNYKEGGVYSILHRRVELLYEYDGKKVPAATRKQLDAIFPQLENDMEMLKDTTDTLAWYRHFDEWDQLVDNAWDTYGTDIPKDIKRMMGEQEGGGEYRVRQYMNSLVQGEPRQVNSFGDTLYYSCQDDATSSKSFQLVPDNLRFEDLFKNLQELGKGLHVVRKLLALMLLAQMIIRLFFINLYVITAPIGLACWALPGKVGQGVTRLWLSGFLSTLMVQFVMVVALIITQVMLGNVMHFAGGTPSNTVGGLDENVWVDLMCVACLWFIIRIPALLGTAPMRTMVEAGQMMGQVVGTTMAMQMAELQMGLQAISGAISGLAAAR
ncbi:hypothetical protein EI42_01678 [Thermosporothrix hazakensis]|jgi:hypothetical protein|uniref:TrbL/VirB6 plasmid conjugal transfer protein n=1 Tax=Thermosporothrix hazakensis TaxID=644383 RepID=A0A326U8T4_THEHA|nr:hypothetical protein [Thermosporothrix hazakensis]PZW32586.1 hypothetical protein EI42_01678 [Thermosporothrix hazakensis]GCE49940.1 hypothetical protein KTH_48090 [Thermosporothrix hazakensis]